MATVEFRVVLSFAWWVGPYLRCVYTFAALHGLKPDERKVMRLLRKGLRTRVEPVSRAGAIRLT